MEAGKSPRYACPFNDPGGQKRQPCPLCPSPSSLSLGLGHVGLAVSPQHSTRALKAAACISPGQQKPTLSTPLTPLS